MLPTLTYHSSQHYLILVLSIYLVAHSALSYKLLGSQLKDLETNDVYSFSTESSTWHVSSTFSRPASNGYVLLTLTIPIYDSTCSGNFLIGGYNVFQAAGYPRFVAFWTTYANLPAHTMIYFQINLWLIDNWTTGGDYTEIQFDSRIARTSSLVRSARTTNYCGQAALYDLPNVFAFGRVFHSSSSLTLFFNSYLQVADVYGFRDINLLFAKNPTGVTESACQTFKNDPFAVTFTADCNCPYGQYLDATNQCKNCHSFCETCFGPKIDQCYSCKPLARFNGTQCLGCNIDLLPTCSLATPSQCISCQANYGLLNNISCASKHDLEYPFITKGYIDFCSSLCNINQYVGWDGQCVDKCLSPRVSTAKFEGSDIKFCHPCNKPGYVFLDETCRPNCNILDSTNEAIPDLDFTCRVCSDMEIQYQRPITDGHLYNLELFPSTCTLHSKAVEKYLTATANSKKLIPPFSFHVTQSGGPTGYLVRLLLESSLLQKEEIDVNIYYLSAAMPVPKKFVRPSFLKGIDDSVSTAKISITICLAFILAGSLIIGDTTALWSILSFQQFVSYFTFLNLEFPAQVDIFFSFLRPLIWSVLPNPLASMARSMFDDSLESKSGVSPNTQAPLKFYYNYYSSSFLENEGTLLMLNLGLLFILGILIAINMIPKFSGKKIQSAISVLKWNAILRIFIETSTPLMLAILLQIRALGFSTSYLSLASIMTIVACAYYSTVLFAVNKILHVKSFEQLRRGTDRRMYGTLYEGILLNNPASKYYYSLLLIRGVFILFVEIFIDNIPMMQIVLILYYNIYLVYYMFKQIRFENKKLTYMNQINQVLILLAECCVFGLHVEIGQEVFYNFFGWLLVGTLGVAYITEVAFALGLVLYDIKTIARWIYRLFRKIWIKIRGIPIPSVGASKPRVREDALEN